MALVGVKLALFVVGLLLLTQVNGLCSDWTELEATDQAANDEFGYSIAATETRAAISSYGTDKVYVYGVTDVVIQDWSLLQQLQPSNYATGNDQFGVSLAMYGNIIAVGANDADAYGQNNNGAVYIFQEFVENPFIYSEMAIIYASIPCCFPQGDEFGFAIDLHETTLVVGMIGKDSITLSSSSSDDDGAIEVFYADPADVNGATTWTQVDTTITAPNPSLYGYFGHAVAIGGPTSNVIVVGEVNNDAYGTNAGLAHVYDNDGTDVTFVMSLASNDLEGADNFGNALDIADDASFIVVCAKAGDYDSSANHNSGTAIFFAETALGEGNWMQVWAVYPSDAGFDNQGAGFGTSVSIYGTNVLFGAPIASSHLSSSSNNNGGAAYVFTMSEFAPNEWFEMAKLECSGCTSLGFGDKFGTGVALAGYTAFVGAPGKDDVASNAGFAGYFEHVCGTYPIACLDEDPCVNGFCVPAGFAYSSPPPYPPPSSSPPSSPPYYPYSYYSDSPYSECLCDMGFQGDICDMDVDDCLSSPCMNDGSCSDAGTNAFSCNCTGTGYEGVICTLDVDDCASSPCLDGESCMDNGWFAYTCSDIDDCASSPCDNNGTCMDAGLNNFTCVCTHTGFEGDLCQSDIDDCASNPCSNNGVCKDTGADMFSCTCDGTGYEGPTCKQDIDDCISSPCENTGICTDTGANNYTCDCVGTGFEGSMCEIQVDDCTSSPCDNNGVCADLTNAFTCDCANTGFVGDFCTDNIDDCASSPCDNGGTCVDGVLAFTCNCEEHYVGDICDEIRVYNATEVGDNALSLEIIVSGFNLTDEELDAFIQYLPILLAEDLNAYPGDISDVAISENADGTYSILFVYSNAEGKTIYEVEEELGDAPALAPYVTDQRLLLPIEEEAEEEEEVAYSQDLQIYLMSALIGSVLIFFITLSAWYFDKLKKQNEEYRKKHPKPGPTTSDVGKKDTMTMPV